MCSPEKDRACRSRPRQSARITFRWPTRRRRTGVLISLASSRARPLARTVVMKNLGSPVKRIDHENPVLRIDRDPGRQLGLSRFRALASEVIEQIALAIENLHHAPQSIHDIQVAFGIDSDAFWPEHRAAAVADAPDGKPELPGPIKYLYAKVHGIDHDQVVPIQAQFGGIVEFTFSPPVLSERLQYRSLHVEHENLVA